MRTIRPLRRFRFTAAELEWLGEQAMFNELAADIIVRWTLLHGNPEKKWRRVLERVKS